MGNTTFLHSTWNIWGLSQEYLFRRRSASLFYDAGWETTNCLRYSYTGQIQVLKKVGFTVDFGLVALVEANLSERFKGAATVESERK